MHKIANCIIIVLKEQNQCF